MRALWTAATAMESQQLRIDVIANNLANVSTPGYKRSRADFQDLLYQVLKLPGGGSAAGNQVPTGLQLGLGVKPAAISKMFTQGDYLKTGNPLDIAIEGSGFFQILQPTGEASYTRAGAFKIDSNGRVVTSDGIPLEPEILIPADAVDIYVGADGTVSVSIPGQLEAQEVGRIELATFVNQAGLRNIGKNLFVPTSASGEATIGTPGENGYGSLSQSYLEMSNVDMMEELVNMIIAQRAYETNSKVIQTSDEMLHMTNSLKR